MKTFLKTKIAAIGKKAMVLTLLVCTLVGVGVTPMQAANEYYYKGFDIVYNDGDGTYYDSKTWNGGFLWLTKYQEDYYLTRSFFRSLTYYHDTWVANQGQTLKITTSKSTSRTVKVGVSAEVGIKTPVPMTFGADYEDSTTTTYSTSLGLEYDLSKFSHNSYRIAAMGYYDEFWVSTFANGTYESGEYRYGYDANFGQEIRLVYRY